MTKHSMTKEQARATEPELTAWVGASAGTGKTHVLTARVLRLMLTGTEPNKILCLTFTKAAAAEMKTRLFEELGKWTVMDDAALKKEIKRRTEEEVDAEKLSRARMLFAEVLDVAGGLQIQTFHSFCQSLLGRFPLEAGLTPGFEGIDDTLSGEVLREARDKMLASTRLVTGGAERKALETVAQRVTELTFDEVMNSLMFKTSSIRNAEEHYGRLGLRPALCRALDISPDDTRDSIIASAVSDRVMNTTALRDVVEIYSGGSKTEDKIAEAIRPMVINDEGGRGQYFGGYVSALLTLTATPQKNIGGKKTLDKNPDVETLLRAEQERLVHVMQKLKSLEISVATSALLTLGIAQMDHYSGLKGHRGLVDFDDMIESTVKLLSSDGIASWVQFKLDGGIHHILVDEAQDTNRAQWHVVETLASAFYDGDGAVDKARTVFAVGDIKQSIFSFQKADPQEFVNARTRVFERAETGQAETDLVPLNQSFRSGEAVLSLVDSVFHESGDAVIDEDPVEHAFTRKGHAGLAEIWPLEEPSTKTQEQEGWIPPTEQIHEDNAEQRTAWRIAKRIKTMLETGELLEAQGRPIKPGDILVLVRKRTDFVEHLTRALKILGVPVTGRDRMTLTSELAVQDLIAVMKFALQPDDDLTCAELLKGPFVGASEDDVFDLAYGRSDKALWPQVVAKKDKYPRAYTFLNDILSIADRGTPFEFLSHILNALGGRKKLAARLGDEVNDPIDELLGEALKFERQHHVSLQAFLQVILMSNTTIKRDMEQASNAVRIMTAHGSKGLQAPIVFIADGDNPPTATKDTRLMEIAAPDAKAPKLLVWSAGVKNMERLETEKSIRTEKMLAEYKRLLYVAMTRAEDRLYIVGWNVKKRNKGDSWYGLMQAGFDRLDDVETITIADRDVRRFNVAQGPEISPSKQSEQKKQGHLIEPLPAWVYGEAPDEPTPPRPLAPSRPDDVEPACTSPLSRVASHPFKRGRIIHTLLEWLPDVKITARETAAKTFLSEPSNGLSGSQVDQTWSEVEALLNDANFAGVFGPNSRAEVPVAGMVMGRVISGQVDRLVVADDHILIVDYKTNRPPPKDVSLTPQIYVKQMALYAAALKQIYPDKEIRAGLLWTDIAKLMMVPADMMQSSLSGM